MKNKFVYILTAAVFITMAVACKKSDNKSDGGTDFATLETTVINDFANKTALGDYGALRTYGAGLQTSIEALTVTTTPANLAAARDQWKAMRKSWEQCEGFLFGPVEDNDYDPNTDTWPTDYNQMDSLLASSNALTADDIKVLPQSLRGYHPIEYMIFGKGGSKTSADLTERQKTYLSGLTEDVVVNNVNALYNDWTAAPTNYKEQVLTAGSGSTQFTTKQELFLNIAAGMSGICDEVGTGKMYEPFVARDSSITESPYSSNTKVDFQNNIIGVQNVFNGLDGGKGLKDLVAAKNSNLSNRISTAITTAVNSFDNITERYEVAIHTQRTQIQQTMDALAALQSLLDNELKAYITENVKD